MPQTKKWSRPESVSYPQVWKRFDGPKPLPNGQILKIRIQDFTEDLRESVIAHMCKHFARDEPVSANQNMVGDPLAIEEMKGLWNQVLDQKLALVALLENKDELEDKKLPYLMGCNMTHVSERNEPKQELKAIPSRRLIESMDDLRHIKKNCFDHFQVSEYMYALGLSVDPIYRGQGVGLQLLKSRLELCRAVGLQVTVTIFTAIASQRQAVQAGFETLLEVNFEDYKDEKGEPIFKEMTPKTAKLMAYKVQ